MWCRVLSILGSSAAGREAVFSKVKELGRRVEETTPTWSRSRERRKAQRRPCCVLPPPLPLGKGLSLYPIISRILNQNKCCFAHTFAIQQVPLQELTLSDDYYLIPSKSEDLPEFWWDRTDAWNRDGNKPCGTQNRMNWIIEIWAVGKQRAKVLAMTFAYEILNLRVVISRNLTAS